jgi:hypothetical protein
MISETSIDVFLFWASKLQGGEQRKDRTENRVKRLPAKAKQGKARQGKAKTVA